MSMCYTHILYILYMEFGRNFKELRKQAGLTQKEVARKLGICQSNVSDWENDISRPEYEKLIALAKLYDASLEELLGVRENLPTNDFDKLS